MLKTWQVVNRYFHFGLIPMIMTFLSKVKSSDDNLKVTRREGVFLRINCDGIPLFKSSKAQFWPILCLISNNKYLHNCHPSAGPIRCQMSLVGLFLGNSKPKDVREYLFDFLKEWKCLCRNDSIVFEEKIIAIYLLKRKMRQ